MKGVNIARSPKQEKTEVKVVDGEIKSVEDVLFRAGLLKKSRKLQKR